MSINTTSKKLLTSRGVTTSTVGGGGNAPTITTVQITDSSYNPLDDLAVDVGGGYLKLLGTNFRTGCTAYINGVACTTTFINSTEVRVITNAVIAGTYSIMLFNSDKSGAIYLNLTASPFPIFSTSAGSLASVYETATISSTLAATSNSTVSYTISSGSLPPGVTLNSATGVLSGSTELTGSNTTYSFVVDATDQENQNSSRSFSLTVNTDIVTWNSPADLSTISLPQNTATTQPLLATSAAGKTISYSANQLPAGLTVSGSNVTGTPTTLGNTTTVFTATAAITGRSATRTVYWTVVIASDQYFPYVPLLLETTATSTRSTTVLDSSNSPLTVTRTGSPSTGWISPYQTNGYWSTSFPSATNQYLSTAYSTAFNFASSTPLTIEFWFNTTGFGGASNTFISNYNSASAGWTVQFRADVGNVFRFALGDTIIINSSAQTIVAGTWYHLAVVRNASNSISMYLNGASIATPVTNSGAFAATTQGLWIGGLPAVGQYYHGYISNLRVVNGAAVYTGAFTPPTTPLAATQTGNGSTIQAITGTATSLLACQSNRFIDNSVNPFTLTPTGTPQVTPYFYPSTFTAPTASPGAGFFNGTTDYLTTASANIAALSGQFTIEGWFYFNSVSASTQTLCGKWSTSLFGWIIQVTNAAVSFSYGNGTTFTAALSYATTFTSNTWYHIAVVRNASNSISVYVNGFSIGTPQTVATSFNSAANFALAINLDGAQQYFNGYISNFRLVNGTPVYTGNFTPPTLAVLQTSGSTSAASYPSTTNINTTFAAANTSLLINLADSNYTSATNAVQNNTFIDSGPYAFPITRSGSATQGSVTPYWPEGYWGSYFTGGNYASNTTASANLRLDQGNWTIEFWVYLTAWNTNNRIFDTGANGDAGVLVIGYANTGAFYFGRPTAGTGVGTATGAITLNRWYHIACTSEGAGVNGRIYINGVLAAGPTNYTNPTGTTATFQLGRNNVTPAADWSGLQGYMSNFRFVSGQRLYTANFTPQITPLNKTTYSVDGGVTFSNITGTTQLLTLQSNRFKDNSNNNFAFTTTGNPQVQLFQPFSPPAAYSPATYGGSGYLFGSASDYLSVADSAAFNLSSTSWTIEAWVYPTARTATYSSWIVGKRNIPSPYTWVWGIGINSTGYPEFYGTSATMTASILAPLNAWTHIAAVHNGSTVTIYVNGVVGVGPTSYAISTNTAPVTIGNYSVDNPFFTGYISNLRIVKGTAVYTGAFTPTTTPLTAIANTSLLLNYTNAAIYDASSKSVLTTVGDAQGSTTQAKYSPTSIKFDGTGDYLTVQGTSPELAFGSRDFTIEFWVYVTAATTNIFFDFRPVSTNGVYPYLYANSDNLLRYYVSSLDRIVAGTAFTINTWNHVALIRTSGVTKLFLNSVQQGSSYTDTNVYLCGTNRPIVGGFGFTLGQYVLNGYIQDFRVTNNVARYATGYSTPTATATPTSNTVLLLESDYASDLAQNNTFLDSSTANGGVGFTITRAGTPTQGSVTPYWPDGYWGNYFGTANTDYLSPASSASLAFGNNAYTVEFWIYLPAYTGGDNRIIDLGSANGSFAVSIGNTTKVTLAKYGAVNVFDSNTGFTLNQWNHVAVVRTSTATNGLAIYLNGTNIGTGTDANNWTVVNTPRINGLGGFSMGWVGYLSNLRVVNGVAVYTGAFIPPTTPLTAIQSAGTNIAAITGTATALLTCQSNRFKDNSAQITPAIITPSGTPRTQTFQPFSLPATYTPTTHGGSGFFNGSSDYLTTPANAAFAFGTGDFTIETWLNTNSSASQRIVSAANGSGQPYEFLLVNSGSNVYLNFFDGTTDTGTGANYVAQNQWVHVAVSRQGTALRVFINGTVYGTSINSTNLTNAGVLTIGRYSPSAVNFFSGYISNLRIVKGTAVYTANFTPPAAPVTAIANTSLLLNFTNAAIYDASVQNNAITVANAQASTTITPKWPPTSMKFDGTGDWLTIPASSNIDLGSGNYTIEFWVYPTATTNSLDAVFGYGNFTTMLYHNASTWTLEVSNNGTTNQVALTSTYSVNTWAYFAITRSGSTVTLYKDGVLQGTGTITGSVNTSGKTLYVGNNSGGSQSFTGYIQDFQITKGVSKYNGNFPVPTLPFGTR